MTILYPVVGALAVVLAYTYGAAVIQNEQLVSWYNCTGKSAGNYQNPKSCNKHIFCSKGGVASQRDCPYCAPFPSPMCPEEWLRWDDNSKSCEYASSAECNLEGALNSTTVNSELALNDSETAKAAVKRSQTAQPPTMQEGDACDPEHCIQSGYCTYYFRCDAETKTWVREECDEGHMWVFHGLSHIHGGRCGKWEAVDDETRKIYWADKECLACGYWAEDCSAVYFYRKSHQTSPNRTRLHCDAGAVWDSKTTTCRLCENVKDSAGAPCC